MLQNFCFHWPGTIFSLTVTSDFWGELSSSYKFEQYIVQSNADLCHHCGSMTVNQPELWGWSLAKLHDLQSIHFFFSPFFLSKKVSKWWNDSNNFPMENPISLKAQNLKIVIFTQLSLQSIYQTRCWRLVPGSSGFSLKCAFSWFLLSLFMETLPPMTSYNFFVCHQSVIFLCCWGSRVYPTDVFGF